MSSTAVTGIGELVTCDGTGPDLLGIRSNAALVVEDGMIAWIGPAADAPSADTQDRCWRAGDHPRFRRFPQPPGVRW